MVVGLLAGLGLPARTHSMNSATWYEWIGLLAWLATYILCPIWSFWFGRSLIRSLRPPGI
ncbi:MAG: hypothetical protein M3067_08140 [Chloroflexota bacterium]|nr:hypothetical protein [Chloroflexota bacterium]